MAGLVQQLVDGVIDGVLKEILRKTGVGTTKRKKRQARTATGRFKKAAAKLRPALKKAGKQVSRRRTAAARSKARQP